MKNTWQTPDYVFKWLDEKFNFKLDVCASQKNAKCNFYWSIENSALDKNWNMIDVKTGEKLYNSCFMNPPYSRGNLPKFMKKAYEEGQKGVTVVCLVPLDTTNWMRDWVKDKSEVWIPDERICFIDPDTGESGDSPSKGNMVVIYGPNARLGHVEFIHIPE